MTWVRLDDQLPSNPKLAQISDRAFRVYIHALCWSAGHRLDGRLPRGLLKVSSPLCSAQGLHAAARELVANGCWHERDYGWEIHDFLEYNPSHDEMDDVSVIRGKVGTYGNHMRWHVKRGQHDPTCPFCTGEPLSQNRKPDRKCDAFATPTPIANRSLARANPVPVPYKTPPSPPEGEPSAMSAPPPPDDAAPEPRTGDDGHPAEPDYTAEFETFWNAYPRKTAKDAAYRAWVRTSAHRYLDAILAALDVQKASRQWQIENGRYVPKPATWLTGGRWKDEPPPPAGPPRKTAHVPAGHPCAGRGPGEHWTGDDGTAHWLAETGRWCTKRPDDTTWRLEEQIQLREVR